MNLTLHMAAKGHLALDFNELSEAGWLSIAEELTSLQGLKRAGSSITSVSEQIHHDFQCAEFSLASGWDNWSRHYLLSDYMAGDIFLRKLFDRFLA
jgi:hypothetical protein